MLNKIDALIDSTHFVKTDVSLSLKSRKQGNFELQKINCVFHYIATENTLQKKKKKGQIIF